MGFNQQQHSGSHGHHSAAADGVSHSQRVNSPRFSGPMTRRAQSFKRSNGGQSSHKSSSSHKHHHEIDVHLNSPRSELAYSEGSVDGFESVVEKKQTHHHHRVTQRLHIKKFIGFGSGGGLEWGSREKKKLGHWMFFLFCGMCLFLGILKICAIGWFGSAIERVGFNQVSSFPAMKLNI